MVRKLKSMSKVKICGKSKNLFKKPKVKHFSYGIVKWEIEDYGPANQEGAHAKQLFPLYGFYTH